MKAKEGAEEEAKPGIGGQRSYDRISHLSLLVLYLDNLLLLSCAAQDV